MPWTRVYNQIASLWLYSLNKALCSQLYKIYSRISSITVLDSTLLKNCRGINSIKNTSEFKDISIVKCFLDKDNNIFNLRDKVIVITGSNGQLGKSMSEFFKKLGATVLELDIKSINKQTKFYNKKK